MKKSRSSVPLLADSAPPCPVPPVRKEGLFATAGLPDPEPPLPAAAPLVAIAVGKTKEGESFPAKPSRNQFKSLEYALVELLLTEFGEAGAAIPWSALYIVNVTLEGLTCP